MTWEIGLTDRAKKDVRALPADLRSRIGRAINGLPAGDTRPLKGRHGEWRLRVGEWRVIYEVDNAGRKITVKTVRPRGGAYQD